MLDIKWIREHPKTFDNALGKRGLVSASDHILACDQALRTCMTHLQEKQSAQNALAKTIGMARSKGESCDTLMAQAYTLKEDIAQLEAEESRLREALHQMMVVLPNIPQEDVPLGESADDNHEIRRWGISPSFDFKPKTHFELGESLGLMDFEKAARMSGARFVILMGDLARLERALGLFMLESHEKKYGYTPVSAPLLVRDNAVFGTGQLPKFAEDLFQTTDGRWLIPTAEVSLTNLWMNQIIDEACLPYRYTALTPCFRSEAGSAGRDTRGMIRSHQFYKVEMVSLVHPDHSAHEHERMTEAAESILQQLNLPYRVMLLCTKDMGATAEKTYDLEVWLPSENTYREISSCSRIGDYQARRMNTRFKETLKEGSKSVTRFVHTLNGSGLAVGRTLVAILENYQQSDGCIIIPEALRPYMDGQEVIGR